jgi:hypothetical protein
MPILDLIILLNFQFKLFLHNENRNKRSQLQVQKIDYKNRKNKITLEIQDLT